MIKLLNLSLFANVKKGLLGGSLMILLGPVPAWAELCSPQSGPQLNVSKILEAFDGTRAPGKGSETQIRLTTQRKNTEREQNFRVIDNGKGASIVEFLDPQQRGTRILSDDNTIWFYASKTRRAIKIPAIQRVFGEASYGDLTQLMLSRDYTYTGPICAEKPEDNNIYRISLQAISDDETYAKLNLIVAAETYLPIGIDYYVASGKHIKSARFPHVKNIDDVTILGDWKLFTPEKEENITWIKTVNYADSNWPDSKFTRRALENGR